MNKKTGLKQDKTTFDRYNFLLIIPFFFFFSWKIQKLYRKFRKFVCNKKQNDVGFDSYIMKIEK